MKMSDIPGTPEIKVFRPKMDEFRNFKAYMAKIESTGAQAAGVCKIIPPPEWKPVPPLDLRKMDNEINAPIVQRPQEVAGEKGTYFMYNYKLKKTTVNNFVEINTSNDSEFREKANKYAETEDPDYYYWRDFASREPQYGADVKSTLMKDEKIWNINKLDSILSLDDEIDGINTSYLYFGMYGSTFAWHTEDMDLHSINYLIEGCPKIWYFIPDRYADVFEDFVRKKFPELADKCKNFLRHKSIVISPAEVRKAGIPVNRIEQKKNEIIITFPRAYHQGYNSGFNVAESTNFATPYWVEFGKRVTFCTCGNLESVKIDMQKYIEEFQPARNQQLLEDNDLERNLAQPGEFSDDDSDKEVQIRKGRKGEDDDDWVPGNQKKGTKNKKSPNKSTPSKSATSKRRGRPRKISNDDVNKRAVDTDHVSSNDNPSKKQKLETKSRDVNVSKESGCEFVSPFYKQKSDHNGSNNTLERIIPSHPLTSADTTLKMSNSVNRTSLPCTTSMNYKIPKLSAAAPKNNNFKPNTDNTSQLNMVKNVGTSQTKMCMKNNSNERPTQITEKPPSHVRKRNKIGTACIASSPIVLYSDGPKSNATTKKLDFGQPKNCLPYGMKYIKTNWDAIYFPRSGEKQPETSETVTSSTAVVSAQQSSTGSTASNSSGSGMLSSNSNVTPVPRSTLSIIKGWFTQRMKSSSVASSSSQEKSSYSKNSNVKKRKILRELKKFRFQRAIEKSLEKSLEEIKNH